MTADQTLSPYDGFTPFGRFDLFAALKSLHLPTEYDAIVAWSDAFGSNQPVNLDAFNCPKVLCVGDTHHMEKPLRKMIFYARDAHYDFIVSSHNRQHLHWFIEAGFENVAWLPGIKVQNLSRPFSTERRKQVCFLGATGKLHPRRTRLLAEVTRRKVFPLVALLGTRERGADLYSSSLVSLNCSLNGDLNLRVFEILAAGGCLLTDRLSRQSGIDLLLREFEEYLGYDDLDECIHQAKLLFAAPALAVAIAKRGREAFTARMRPEQRVEQLFAWVFQGRLDPLFRVEQAPGRDSHVVDLLDRLRLYEQLQEIHRLHDSPAILFMNDVPPVHVKDASDLRHLKISVAQDTGTSESKHEMAEVYSVADRARLQTTLWDCIVTTNNGELPNFIRARQVLRIGVESPP